MNRLTRSLFILSLAYVAMWSSCVTTQQATKPDNCAAIVREFDWEQPISTLNQISDLYYHQCYNETITFANEAKARYGHKTFSFSKESLEFFSAEGTFTDYVLESYERGYLSFLISASYVRLNQSKEASVELNKFYNEETALTYNHGQDPVNALIQAAMWDNVHMEGFSSRPFWQWLVNAEKTDAKTRAFATRRLVQIDNKEPKKSWQIWEVGSFPNLEWSTQFAGSKNGYFAITPSTPFPKTCSNAKDTLVLPTTSWFQKIAARHSHGYHPLVNIKSWVRLPIGLIYGVTTFSAGAGIMVGGCAIDVGMKGSGNLCKASIEGGAFTMGKSRDAVDYTIKPDLRHWESLPEAIMIAPADASPTTDCLNQKPESTDFRIL